MKIVETDNFSGDYPDEKFVNQSPVSKDAAEEIVKYINKRWSGDRASRYWKVVEDDYKLQPGFEP